MCVCVCVCVCIDISIIHLVQSPFGGGESCMHGYVCCVVLRQLKLW